MHKPCELTRESCVSSCLQSFQFNLIITDYCMPSMTGYDLLKKVKVTTGTFVGWKHVDGDPCNCLLLLVRFWELVLAEAMGGCHSAFLKCMLEPYIRASLFAATFSDDFMLAGWLAGWLASLVFACLLASHPGPHSVSHGGPLSDLQV